MSKSTVSFAKLALSLVVLSLSCPRSWIASAQLRSHAITPGRSAVAAAQPAYDFNSSAPYEQAIHLGVGHSIFVNTKHRLSRIYVTNPATLDSYTVNPYQIVITAKKTGTSTVIVWDESGESKSYLISSDIDVAALRSSLQEALPNENVQVQGNEGRVILTGMVGTDAESDAAVKLATLYTKDVSNSLVVNAARIKQVRLKVRIIEVDRSRLNQFGFNFFSAGGNNIAGTTTTQYPSTYSVQNGGSGGQTGNSAGSKSVTISDALNFLFYSSKYNIGATMRDLENKQVLQILAEPTITTLSGQKANFLAGGEFPFPVVQGSSGGLTSVTIQFRPYGVKLEFTPVVNTDGTIELKVAPEVSALDYTNAVNISGYTIPALSTRRAETQMVLRSGQSFAISGLLDKRTTDAYGRTPGIASVPILGQLFKSKGINQSNSELIVIVTPTIVDPLTETFSSDEPQPSLPMMDTKTFDQALPRKSKTK